MSWSTTFVSLKLYVEFYIFDSGPFLFKFIFLFYEKREFFDFKVSYSNSHTVLLTDVWFKIQWYLSELELRRTRPEDNFFKLRKLKFWERQFLSTIVTF